MKIFLILIATGLAWGQTTRKDVSTRTVTGTINAINAAETRPFRVTSTAPSGSCSKDREVVAVADVLHVCESGTWTKVNATYMTDLINANVLTGVTGDIDKLGKWTSSGAAFKHVTQLAPITISALPNAISGTPCTIRDAVYGGKFYGVEIHSIDDAGANLSGSITVRWAVTTNGGGAYTTLGDTVLSSAARVVDETFSGWSTTTVSAGASTKIRMCVVSSSTVKHVVISPRFH